ncbi:type VI secretion protein [Chromobacterium paludis]|uniref:Type VI secretion protein n=2 Tax=Chromobacterium paludis TaxID=2605945 RepID=A0A5C1DPI2_9NEIS|nr:type VI secretion protein [Chromobacterium paludis]
MRMALIGFLLPAVCACSVLGWGPSVKLQTVRLDMASRANDDAPLAVDFVAVKDPELLKVLLGMPAAKWFEQREQFRRDYPDGLKVWSLELVPGQHVETDQIPIRGESAAGLLVFASYAAPGMHRLNLDARKSAWLRFESQSMQLLGQ